MSSTMHMGSCYAPLPMSTHGIIQRFGEWRESGEPMVLATVYDTLGSTYTKAGHRILIAANGDYQGLVSGGCLEGDLAERAHKVLETGTATTVTYDMRDDGEDLWGLGVGCNGLIRVFLQQLSPGAGYEPFTAIANGLLGVKAAGMAVVVASGESDLVSGATLIWDGDARSAWQLDPARIAQLAPGCTAALEQRSMTLEVGADGAAVDAGHRYHQIERDRSRHHGGELDPVDGDVELQGLPAAHLAGIDRERKRASIARRLAKIDVETS